MMKYNQAGVTAIVELQSTLESASMNFEMLRKILSILDSVEYQIEEGVCPAGVLAALQNAVTSWLKRLPEPMCQDLQHKVNDCFRTVAETMK
jgi:hypothetical protein